MFVEKSFERWVSREFEGTVKNIWRVAKERAWEC